MITDERRRAGYQAQRHGGPLTPRQLRRARHKVNAATATAARGPVIPIDGRIVKAIAQRFGVSWRYAVRAYRNTLRAGGNPEPAAVEHRSARLAFDGGTWAAECVCGDRFEGFASLGEARAAQDAHEVEAAS